MVLQSKTAAKWVFCDVIFCLGLLVPCYKLNKIYIYIYIYVCVEVPGTCTLLCSVQHNANNANSSAMSLLFSGFTFASSGVLPMTLKIEEQQMVVNTVVYK